VRRGPSPRTASPRLDVPLPERHARLGLDPGPCLLLPTAPAGRTLGSRLVAPANLPRPRDITLRSLGALGPGILPAIIPEHSTTACQGGCSPIAKWGPCLTTSSRPDGRSRYQLMTPPWDPPVGGCSPSRRSLSPVPPLGLVSCPGSGGHGLAWFTEEHTAPLDCAPVGGRSWPTLAEEHMGQPRIARRPCKKPIAERGTRPCENHGSRV
jgi:hypothetical protein